MYLFVIIFHKYSYMSFYINIKFLLINRVNKIDTAVQIQQEKISQELTPKLLCLLNSQ